MVAEARAPTNLETPMVSSVIVIFCFPRLLLSFNIFDKSTPVIIIIVIFTVIVIINNSLAYCQIMYLWSLGRSKWWHVFEVPSYDLKKAVDG